MSEPSVLSSESKRNKHADKLARFFGIVFLVLAFLILILEVLFLMYGRNLFRGEDAMPQMRAAAEQFKTESEWELLDNQEVDEPGICLVTYCAHIEQVWAIGERQMDCPALQQILVDSGFSVMASTGEGPVCTSSAGTLTTNALAADGTLTVRLTAYQTAAPEGQGDENPDATQLVLHISKAALEQK